ncbi:hypothetical protein [Mucilaginibacter terrenus]|nr:hypothetical protein [Mucilaginibacter terrenus]
MKRYFVIGGLCLSMALVACGGKSEKNSGADTSSMSVDPSGGGDATGSGATGTTADTLGMHSTDTSSTAATKGTGNAADTTRK